jgi:hypothetical protein
VYEIKNGIHDNVLRQEDFQSVDPYFMTLKRVHEVVIGRKVFICFTAV